MNVSVDVSGDVEVDDGPNMGNVETSGGDVCGHQDRELPLFEGMDDLVSLVLKFVATKLIGSDKWK
jgi:hypothetical protein